MHALTCIQEAFQRDPDDLIYIITFQLCLFVLLSQAVMYIFSSTHLHFAMCISRFLFRSENSL